MAENKKGFVLYADQKSIIDMLPNDKAGELLKHIFAYVNDENPVNEDPLINLAFEPIKLQLKRDLQKWEETRVKRSIAGSISAEKRKQQNQQVLTSVESVEQVPTKSTVIVNDNVNVNVNVNDINNISSSTKNEFSQEVIQTFNSVVGYFETTPETETKKNKWLDCIDKLNRIDGLSFNEIIQIVKFGKEDEFWNNNFLSLLKLRNKNKEDIYYWNVFKSKMKPKQESSVTITLEDKLQSLGIKRK